MSTAPDLPIDLHGEILRCLHHYRDRRTLLSTALVNGEWSKQSQRVLFSKMADREYGNREQRENVVLPRHMDFLRTIAEHPHRLGPLVVSYAQYGLASDLAESSDLWELMAQALPAMINLKHLFLLPRARSLAKTNWVSSSALVKSFTFQLEMLIWGCSYHPDNGFPEFLGKQHDIIHLESETLASLDDNICPHLISIAGGLNSLSHVTRSRNIIALRWLPKAVFVAHDSSALGPLKYLSVYDYKIFRNIIGPIKLNITLLELTEESWKNNTFASLANMPRLQVLVVHRPRRGTLSNKKITKQAFNSFKGLPSLEYIIQRDYLENGDGYRYLKLSRSANSTDDFLQQELMIYYNIGAPWWTVYNV